MRAQGHSIILTGFQGAELTHSRRPIEADEAYHEAAWQLGARGDGQTGDKEGVLTGLTP